MVRNLPTQDRYSILFLDFVNKSLVLASNMAVIIDDQLGKLFIDVLDSLRGIHWHLIVINWCSSLLECYRMLLLTSASV